MTALATVTTFNWPIQVRGYSDYIKDALAEPSAMEIFYPCRDNNLLVWHVQFPKMERDARRKGFEMKIYLSPRHGWSWEVRTDDFMMAGRDYASLDAMVRDFKLERRKIERKLIVYRKAKAK